jgi:MFS family permease
MTAQAIESATPQERRALAVGFGAHALHDGLTSLLLVMLPIWQAEFGLTYALVGVLRSAMHGTMAALQIPSGLLAERYGTALILGTGTALSGLCYALAGTSAGFVSLAVALFVGGIGASTQHPVASALVARAFAGSRALTALGTYNFGGDLGAMAIPAAVGLLVSAFPWRTALLFPSALAFVTAAAIFVLTPRFAPEPAKDIGASEAVRGHTGGRDFSILFGIGVIDSATRAALLVFLPFLLAQKGASLPTIGFAITLVFAGGAVGKLACGFIGARIGEVATIVLTETMTAAGIFLLLPLPLNAGLAVLPFLGLALNGTSSVLYGSVPKFCEPDKRARAFGMFYTGTIGAAALAPIVYGAAGDWFGVTRTIVLIGSTPLLTLPLALMLRDAFMRD